MQSKCINIQACGGKMDKAVLTQLKSLKDSLKENFGINQIAVFGSYAKDENNQDSDLDIVVLSMDKKNAFTLIRAKNYLNEQLNKEVDLGLFDSLRPFIKRRVEKEMIHV